jgi:hypothetical protein
MKNLKVPSSFFVQYGLILCLMLVFLFLGTEASAQCPMCRITAESNLKDGGTMGRGLNNGILYMFFTPYLIVAGIGIWWWRNNRKEDDENTIALDSMEEEEVLV